jgi:hypothetical protein
MNQQEAPKAVILSGLRAGHTRRQSMSYEDIKQSTDNKVRKKFERSLSLLEDLLIFYDKNIEKHGKILMFVTK